MEIGEETVDPMAGARTSGGGLEFEVVSDETPGPGEEDDSMMIVWSENDV